MAELQSLRSRVEQVQVKLKAANAARTSESEALSKLWQQIRARYTAQEKELAELRSRSAELEDTRDELLGLVRHLLEATEGATEGISDSTVPEISRMAGELLATGNQPKPDPVAAPAAPEPVAMTDAPELHDKPTPAPQQAVAPPPPPAPKPAATEPVPVTESLSPGIRTLIARVEGVFDEGEDKDTTTDDEFGGAD